MSDDKFKFPTLTEMMDKFGPDAKIRVLSDKPGYDDYPRFVPRDIVHDSVNMTEKPEPVFVEGHSAFTNDFEHRLYPHQRAVFHQYFGRVVRKTDDDLTFANEIVKANDLFNEFIMNELRNTMLQHMAVLKDVHHPILVVAKSRRYPNDENGCPKISYVSLELREDLIQERLGRFRPAECLDESHSLKLPNNDEGDGTITTDVNGNVITRDANGNITSIRVKVKPPADIDLVSRNMAQYPHGADTISTSKYARPDAPKTVIPPEHRRGFLGKSLDEIVTDEELSQHYAKTGEPVISEQDDDAIRYPMTGDVWKSYCRKETVSVLKTTPRLVWVGFSYTSDITDGEVKVMSRDQYNAFMRVGGHKEDNYKTLSPFRPTSNKYDINNSAKFALLGRSSTEDDLMLMGLTLKTMIDTNRPYTEYTPV